MVDPTYDNFMTTLRALVAQRLGILGGSRRWCLLVHVQWPAAKSWLSVSSRSAPITATSQQIPQRMGCSTAFTIVMLAPDHEIRCHTFRSQALRPMARYVVLPVVVQSRICLSPVGRCSRLDTKRQRRKSPKSYRRLAFESQSSHGIGLLRRNTARSDARSKMTNSPNIFYSHEPTDLLRHSQDHPVDMISQRREII
jgi:hypothetical protein